MYGAHLSYEEIKEFAGIKGLNDSDELSIRASEHISYCQDCLDKVNKMREQIAAISHSKEDLRAQEEKEIVVSRDKKTQMAREIGDIELEIDSLMKRVGELKARLNDYRENPGELEAK